MVPLIIRAFMSIVLALFGITLQRGDFVVEECGCAVPCVGYQRLFFR